MLDLPETVCGYLNGWTEKLCDFVPETFGAVNPQAGVFFREEVRANRYVDGSVCVQVPFDICLRIGGASVREKLDGMRFLGGAAVYMRENPLRCECRGGRIDGLNAEGSTVKAAVLENGDEEYRLRCRVRVIISGTGPLSRSGNPE